jgi:hypothetical protein
MTFFCLLKLRDHPLVRPHWPPEWTLVYGSHNSTSGEVGILDHIYLSRVTAKRCILLIVYNGTSYIGAITFDDDVFCRRFVDLVQNHRGKSLSRIAELDGAYALNPRIAAKIT